MKRAVLGLAVAAVAVLSVPTASAHPLCIPAFETPYPLICIPLPV